MLKRTAGLIIGSVMLQNLCQLPAPSIEAASYCSGGIPCRELGYEKNEKAERARGKNLKEIDNSNESHRIYVIESDNSDPLSHYSFMGQLGGSDNTTSIDPSLLQVNGQWYILFVEEPGVEHVGEQGANVTYIASLSDPLTQSSSSRSLIYPDQYWERGGSSGQSSYPVSEGPEALYHGGKTFIVYSGSDTGDYTYCLGLLTYNGGDPLDFHSWSKSGPVFQYSDANGVYGPGRASFTTSPDGSQDWMVYHAKSTSSFTYDNRTTRAQPFGWNADGTPQFGTPVSTSTPINPPSGE